MTADQWGLIGLAVTLAVGIIGMLFAKKVKSNRQNQKVGRNGFGIQTGGDVKIGRDDG